VRKQSCERDCICSVIITPGGTKKPFIVSLILPSYVVHAMMLNDHLVMYLDNLMPYCTVDGSCNEGISFHGDSTSPPTAIVDGCCNQGISFDIWRLQSFQIAQCIDLVNRCHYDVVLLADHSITH